MIVAMSPRPMAWVMRNPRPRRDANISPISTPSSVSEKPMRAPAITSGITAGRATVNAVCRAVRRRTRAVRQ